MILTIITSLYKSDAFLKRFLRDAKDIQKELEGYNISFEHLLIMNDPNSEESALVEKASSDNNALRVIKVPRESLYATWNRGVHESGGDIVTFWNVDDRRNSGAIVDGIRIIKSGAAPVVYYPFIYKRYISLMRFPILIKRKKVTPPPFDPIEFGKSMMCGPFFMFSKDFYKKVGAFDEELRIAGDFDWCIRASKKGVFAQSDIVAGTFSNNGTGLSGLKNGRLAEENKKIYERYGIKK